MKPIDILTALDAAGDEAKQGKWEREFAEEITCDGDIVADFWNIHNCTFACDAANARPALKQHLVAVARLVEAARKIVAYDETYHNGRTRFDTSIGVGIGCGDLRALRAALQEVDRG